MGRSRSPFLRSKTCPLIRQTTTLTRNLMLLRSQHSPLAGQCLMPHIGQPKRLGLGRLHLERTCHRKKQPVFPGNLSSRLENMRLLRIEGGSLTALFEYARPIGQPYLPSVFRELVHRYSFSEYPRDFQSMNADSVQFQHGNFNGYAFNVTMYRDGIILHSASNTDIIDDIFADLQGFAKETLSVDTFKAQKTDTMYESVIVFQSEKDVLLPIRSALSIGAAISDKLERTSQIRVDFQPFGFSLAPDVSEISGLKPPPFRVERRGGTPYSFDHYFSTAPLRTVDHVAIIEELESLV